jgi:hypothetical protein
MAAMSFETWLTKHLAPKSLQGPWGTRFFTAIGQRADARVTWAKDAVKNSFPAQAADDALPWVGKARGIDRYFADTLATFRTRIVDAWAQWELAGTESRITSLLTSAGYTIASLVPWREWTVAPDPYATHWSAFWVVLTSHPFASDGIWSDAGTWGDTVSGHVLGSGTTPDGPGTWDSDATEYEVREFRAIVRKWKVSHEVCAAALFQTGAGDFWDSAGTWNNGLWDDSNAFMWECR